MDSKRPWTIMNWSMVALNPWESSLRLQGAAGERVPHQGLRKKWDAVERVPTVLVTGRRRGR